ncbi:MAG: hypothetical protein IT463_14050 [Planctomycetes bacterium]|nr:hypothetical protein [Planctomycetota bacterium]
MRRFLPLLLLGAFLLPACHDSAGNHAHNAAPSDRLELNAGKKWQTDDHTREALQGIRKVMAERPAATPADINALGSHLKTRLDALISGCTMTGPAHDQLHVFLGKFLPVVDRMARETDTEKAKQAHREAGELLAEYDRYFE